MNTRIAIVIPSGDLVHADFAVNLAMLVSQMAMAGHHPVLLNIKSSLVQKGRTKGVAIALEQGADFILFIDSDMVVPPQLPLSWLTLMQGEGSAPQPGSHSYPVEREIIGCLFSRRSPPYRLIGSKPDGSRFTRSDLGQGLVEAETLGTGLMMIHAAVFHRVASPWFHVQQTDGLWMSEDEWFCHAARRAGITVWCDTNGSQEVGHLGQVAFFPHMLGQG